MRLHSLSCSAVYARVADPAAPYGNNEGAKSDIGDHMGDRKGESRPYMRDIYNTTNAKWFSAKNKVCTRTIRKTHRSPAG